MNSAIASHINGGANINQQVAGGSRSSLLLSSIEFSLTETKTNFTPSSYQGKHLIKLSGKEELFNGQKKIKNCDQNKNPLENGYSTVNGNTEKSSDESSGIPTPKIQLFTGKIYVEWNNVYKIGAGLNNLGNTCFMNTVIQCLTYCPPLANYLLQDNDHSSKCTITGFCMMCLLQKHIKRVIGKTGDVVKPIEIYQRLKLIAKHFQFGRQEDAHEFLRYVIDHLWKACLPQSNGISKLDPASKETTIINKIFGGYHRSQVICMRCKKESNTFDHFMDFILDIKQNVMTLEKALDKYIQPELLQQENCYKCPRCKMKVEAQKKFTVYQAPNVATFQLKRFDYNRTFGGKITKQIMYPENLNLRPYMSDPQGDPVWYRLNAVLVHAGPTSNSGHYYCYVKNSNGLWYIMDDQRVHQVSLNQVLNQSAYVLFYIKAETGERTPLKRCLDNKNSFVKGQISNSNFTKVTSTSTLKPMPLTEKSFESNKQPFSSPSNNKKISFPFIQKTEKSFGVQTHATSSPLKNLPSVASAASGLVPYIEDSSESDTSENNQSTSKLKNTENEPKQNDKCSILQSYMSTPRLEVKTKLSKSVFSHSNRSLSSPIPKVRATGSWTVTDSADDHASVSSSNTSSVNSTTDWHVTSVVTVPKLSPDRENKDFNENKISNSENVHLIETLPSNSETVKENNFENLPEINQQNNPSKCNFRQLPQSNFPSHKETFTSPKRKCNDFHSKDSSNSPFDEYGENGHFTPSKKVKYSEKTNLTKEDCVSGSAYINSVNSYNSYKNSPQPHHISNGDIVLRTKSEDCETSHNTELSLNHKNSSSFACVKDNKESSKFSPEKDEFSKVRYKESSYVETSKSLHNEKQHSYSSTMKNTSLYGTDVPTWKGESYHRPSIIPSHRNRSFDDYDNEFDRGKVRKLKMKDHRDYNFHRSNPFQNYADRHHNNKYNGKYYNNSYSHHRKPYDSHRSWKPQKWNYPHPQYKKHHHRHY